MASNPIINRNAALAVVEIQVNKNSVRMEYCVTELEHVLDVCTCEFFCWQGVNVRATVVCMLEREAFALTDKMLATGKQESITNNIMAMK